MAFLRACRKEKTKKRVCIEYISIIGNMGFMDERNYREGNSQHTLFPFFAPFLNFMCLPFEKKPCVVAAKENDLFSS